jgi:gas vesicle protein
MSNENNHHSAKKLVCSIFFIIFFTLFTGIFIGLLVAPQSGRKFRESLKSWLNEMVEKGKFTIEEAKVYSSELLDKSKERVESFSAKIKNE